MYSADVDIINVNLVTGHQPSPTPLSIYILVSVLMLSPSPRHLSVPSPFTRDRGGATSLLLIQSRMIFDHEL